MITYEEGLQWAIEHDFKDAYIECINKGFTPYEALQDWDINN